jgi:hypothetical protein
MLAAGLAAVVAFFVATHVVLKKSPSTPPAAVTSPAKVTPVTTPASGTVGVKNLPGTGNGPVPNATRDPFQS